MARAVMLNVLERHPGADLAMFTLWTDIIASDDAPGARKAVAVLPDPRVQHFYDPNRFVSHQLAPVLGLKSMEEIVRRTQGDMQSVEKSFHPGYAHGPAALFDTVLFYPPGVLWSETPAAHESYVTQLDPSLYLDIDAKRFRYAKELEAELRVLADELLPAPKESSTSNEEPATEAAK